MLTEVALGWSRFGHPPAPVQAEPVGDLHLLTAATTAPREVLALQQMCFAAGMDLLPTCPSRGCTTAEARAMAPNLLSQSLNSLAGKAQMVLHLSWETSMPPEGEAKATGRNWLLARQRRLAQSEAAALWLTTLAERLGASHGTAEACGPDAALLHILVPRDQCPDLPQLIALAADLPDPAPNSQLTLSGPWLPFAFAQLPCP